MNLSELRKASSFSESERISEFTVNQCLVNLKYYGKRIVNLFAKYEETEPSSDFALIILDALKNNFNDYTQVFLDLTLVICADDAISSLSSAVRAFNSKFSPKEPERSFIAFLNERNSIVHEYYNREFLNDRIITLLTNYADGALGVADMLNDYAIKNNLLDVKIRKGKK